MDGVHEAARAAMAQSDTQPGGKRWLAWLRWDDPEHCAWALAYLQQAGMADETTAPDASAHDRLAAIINTWPHDPLSFFGADAFVQLEAQMRVDYAIFAADPGES